MQWHSTRRFSRRNALVTPGTLRAATAVGIPTLRARTFPALGTDRQNLGKLISQFLVLLCVSLPA